MKYVFDKNGIDNSENTERLVQYSVNANELQVAFTDLNIKEYVPYVAFERADGKVSPLIGMAFTDFELSGTKYSGASYSFSDSWVTAQSGILKVAIILKKNNVNVRTSTFNLSVAESISEDKVNYIEDVAYNELVGRVYQLEKKETEINSVKQDITNIINGDLSVGVADKAHSDYFGHEFTEHYETKTGATEKVNELKQKIENGEVVGYSSHRDGVGNNIVETYATKEENTENLDAAKEYADNKIVEIEKNINDNFATKEEIPKQTSQLNNDNGFITKLVDDLVNYYKKNEVLELINQIPKFSISKVEILPTENISETTIYLLRDESGDDKNYYIEYLYTHSGGWEVIGSTKVSLENFYNKEQINLLLDSKVDEETILSDGTIFKFEKIGDVYRIKHADTNGNILQYIDFDFDELIISNNDSKWTMDNDGMKFSKSYTIDGKKYEFTFKNANNEIKLIAGTFIDNIYYIELGGITINEKGLSIQKLISLDNQSIDYINSIIDHAVLGIQENPTTLINGRWKFKETSITTNYGSKTFDVEFYDSVGNIFTQLENTLEGGTSSNRTNVFYGIKSNGEKILIYSNLYKTGLAYSEPNYFIVFNNEVDYLISRLTYFADKHIFKEVASKEYVDKAISNISGNVDLSDYAKKSELPTKLSDLMQDVDYALKEELPTKLSELINDSNFVSRYVKEDNSNNLLDGIWKFNLITDEELANMGTCAVNFRDSDGNSFTQFIKTGSNLAGYIGNSKYIVLYTSDKTGLAFDDNGNLRNDYYLIFEEHRSNVIDYIKINNFISKYIIVNYATEDFVNEVISNQNKIYLDIVYEDDIETFDLEDSFFEILRDLFKSNEINKTCIRLRDTYNSTINYLSIEKYYVEDYYFEARWNDGNYFFDISISILEDGSLEDYGHSIYTNSYSKSEINNKLYQKADKTQLFSKNYNDLNNKPTKLSQFTDDINAKDGARYAGASQYTGKLYLIGATSQATKKDTYSNDKVFIDSNELYSNGYKVLSKNNTKFTKSLYSGTKIGTLKIDDQTTDLYAPSSGPEITNLYTEEWENYYSSWSDDVVINKVRIYVNARYSAQTYGQIGLVFNTNKKDGQLAHYTLCRAYHDTEFGADRDVVKYIPFIQFEYIECYNKVFVKVYLDYNEVDAHWINYDSEDEITKYLQNGTFDCFYLNMNNKEDDYIWGIQSENNQSLEGSDVCEIIILTEQEYLL